MNKIQLQKDFNKIKLIIWDLDNTIWSGVLSEEKVSINPNFVKLIKNLTDYGIVNSICSKNNQSQVYKELEKNHIKEFFVFCSIDWSNKGQRIKKIIADMNLKDKNVLFVDDENINLEEASFYSPNLMVAKPNIIEELCTLVPKNIRNKSNRLDEYKILEKKQADLSSFDSPIDFLKKSNIIVKISNDCEKHLERLHELIMRTNQLNFTKTRLDKTDFESLIKDSSLDCGYIECADKYGYYGIIGFYAKKDNKLIHFAFSCRCLGMRVEQFVYEELKYPTIEIVGETATSLSKTKEVTWIRRINNIEQKSTLNKNYYAIPAIFKGPCDIEQLFAFIHDSKMFIREFNYVSKSKKCSIYQGTHSLTMLQSLEYTEKEKNEIEQLPFYDGDVFKTQLFSIKNGLIFISIMPEGNYSIYQNIETKQKIVFGEHCYNLTDQKTINDFLNKKIWTADFDGGNDFFDYFKKNYRYLGRIPINESCDNYKKIISSIDQSNEIYLLLPSEKHVETKQFAYKDRELYHIELNESIKTALKDYQNVKFIELTNYAKDTSDYTNNVNHFTKKVYYSIAKDIIDIFKEKGSNTIKKSSLFEPLYRLIKKIFKNKTT